VQVAGPLWYILVMKMLLTLITCLAFSMLACAEEGVGQRVVAPDGRPAIVVSGETLAEIAHAASLACPHGYAVIDARDHNRLIAMRVNTLASVRTEEDHEEMIVCAGGAEPQQVDAACLKDPLMRSDAELGVRCPGE